MTYKKGVTVSYSNVKIIQIKNDYTWEEQYYSVPSRALEYNDTDLVDFMTKNGMNTADVVHTVIVSRSLITETPLHTALGSNSTITDEDYFVSFTEIVRVRFSVRAKSPIEAALKVFTDDDGVREHEPELLGPLEMAPISIRNTNTLTTTSLEWEMLHQQEELTENEPPQTTPPKALN